MKLLLLIVAIHLLVFHQYRKDKKEDLAPKKNKPIKLDAPSYIEASLPPGIGNNTNDSLEFSYQLKSVRYNEEDNPLLEKIEVARW